MDRFDQLCARHLDGLATVEETDELARWVRSHPERAKDFRESFQLDQLLAVLHSPTRAEAIDAIVAQLQREADPFVESVAREVSQPSPPEPQARSPVSLFAAWLAEWKWLLRLGAAAAAVVVGLLFWLFGPTMGEPVLAEVQGAGANIERRTEFIPALRGIPLKPGDVLRTGTNARLSLAFGSERTRLNLASGSELRVVSFASGKRFVLQAGRLTNSVARQRPFRPMVLETPHAEARVLGTEFILAVTAHASELDVTEGAVKLTRASDGKSIKVKAGQRTKASPGVELSALPRPGGILREYWTNILGDHPSQLFRHQAVRPKPDGSESLTNFVVHTDWGDNFGDVIRGYVHPPVTGKYTFWISGDGNTTLNLSRNEKPENCIQLAISEGGAPLDWDFHAVQRSSPITLVAGKRYYIEVIRKTNRGRDHLAVAWQPPGGEREIIRGEFLSPFKPGE